MTYFLIDAGFLFGCTFFLIGIICLYINWEKFFRRILWMILTVLSLGIIIVGFLVGPEDNITYTALIKSEPLASVTEDKEGRVIFSRDKASNNLADLGYTERSVSRIVVLNDENATPRRDYFREKTIHYINFFGKIVTKATYSDFYQYYVPRQYVETVSDYNISELDWSDLFAVSG